MDCWYKACQWAPISSVLLLSACTVFKISIATWNNTLISKLGGTPPGTKKWWWWISRGPDPILNRGLLRSRCGGGQRLQVPGAAAEWQTTLFTGRGKTGSVPWRGSGSFNIFKKPPLMFYQSAAASVLLWSWTNCWRCAATLCTAHSPIRGVCSVADCCLSPAQRTDWGSRFRPRPYRYSAPPSHGGLSLHANEGSTALCHRRGQLPATLAMQTALLDNCFFCCY